MTEQEAEKVRAAKREEEARCWAVLINSLPDGYFTEPVQAYDFNGFKRIPFEPRHKSVWNGHD